MESTFYFQYYTISLVPLQLILRCMHVRMCVCKQILLYNSTQNSVINFPSWWNFQELSCY